MVVIDTAASELLLLLLLLVVSHVGVGAGARFGCCFCWAGCWPVCVLSVGVGDALA